MIDYVSIRKCLKQGKDIFLALVHHPHHGQPPPTLPPPAPPAPPPPPPPESLCVWDLSPHAKLRVRVVSVENIRALAERLRAKPAGGYGLYVRAGVYNGGKLLHRTVETRLEAADDASNPQWSCWLQTDLPVCHAPRAARVCFTLFARPVKKDALGDTALAWVSGRAHAPRR